MKAAIMQPYFFPYISYYQLINDVDSFVFLDDVNFIVRGWINRNNILLNGKAHLISISLNKPSRNKLICETTLNFSQRNRNKLLRTIQAAYSRAPYFENFYPIFKEILFYEQEDLTSFLYNSFVKTCEYVGIKTTFIRSSEIEKDESLKSEKRIIEICKKLETKMYVNLSGGKHLYDKCDFESEGLKLRFINTFFNEICYKQYDSIFTGNLSFIDILMFNSQEEIINLLNQYSLVEG